MSLIHFVLNRLIGSIVSGSIVSGGRVSASKVFGTLAMSNNNRASEMVRGSSHRARLLETSEYAAEKTLDRLDVSVRKNDVN